VGTACFWGYFEKNCQFLMVFDWSNVVDCGENVVRIVVVARG
jgi:hypothetical protein